MRKSAHPEMVDAFIKAARKSMFDPFGVGDAMKSMKTTKQPKWTAPAPAGETTNPQTVASQKAVEPPPV